MNDLVVLHTYTYPTEVIMLKTMLAEAGVPVFTFEENTLSIDPFLSNAIGGLKLRVKIADLEMAQSVLKHYNQSLPSAHLEMGKEWESKFEPADTWCPHCDSRNVYAERQPWWKGWLAAFLAFFLWIPWPFLKKMHRCGDCGYGWKY